MSTKTSLEPLVFKVRQSDSSPSTPEVHEKIGLRVEVRTLEGMQKEAIVSQLSPAGSAWRLVSDEGPYLNGTDLAPFPLAFFTAGLQSCLMSQMPRLAKEQEIEIRSLDVTQDNWYTMTGSALRGDMTGGAKPADVSVKIESPAPKDVIANLVSKAEECSPSHAVMRDVLSNTFSLNLNGRQLPVTDVKQSEAGEIQDPKSRLESIGPDSEASFCLK